MPITKVSIQTHAKTFIANGKLTEWPQEAHNCLVAYILKRELDLDDDQVSALMEAQQAMPALTANASAFRQWLQSKDVALLPKADDAKPLGNRYAGLV